MNTGAMDRFYLIFLSFFSLYLAVYGEVPYPSDNNLSGLTLWWRFETNTSIIVDSSGNNNNGSVYLNPVWSNDGSVHGGIYTTGPNGFFSTPLQGNLLNSEDSFTFSFWFRTKSNQAPTGCDQSYPIWSFTAPGEGRVSFGLEGTSVASWYYTTPNGVLFFQNTKTFNDNVWHNMAMTWDANAATITGYFDGVVINTVTNVVLDALDANVQIGLASGAAGNCAWVGAVDDFRIYTRALSASELTAPLPTSVVTTATTATPATSATAATTATTATTAANSGGTGSTGSTGELDSTTGSQVSTTAEGHRSTGNSLTQLLVSKNISIIIGLICVLYFVF